MSAPAAPPRIPESELAFEFFRASGPGGQNVNKVSTAVRLRFDVRRSASLPPEVKARLLGLAAGRVTDAGILMIEARRFRTQERNREDAVDRLQVLVEKAYHVPLRRRPTRPGLAAKKRRLDAKKRRGTSKRRRGAVTELE